MRLDRVDLFFLHNQIVPDASADQIPGTPHRLFVEAVRPALSSSSPVAALGPGAYRDRGSDHNHRDAQRGPAPAAVQVVTNLLDSPGAMQRYDEPPRPREVIAAAHRRGIGVMGIRAVQAGALTDALDRQVPEDHLERRDYQRSAPFRTLARELDESPASLAHRYALSMAGVATVVLGVKNRTELRECIMAQARGVLAPELMARIDTAVGRA
jgi:aryl-alcohol dehydrogenase-like predicted oxidoreductase